MKSLAKPFPHRAVSRSRLLTGLLALTTGLMLAACGGGGGGGGGGGSAPPSGSGSPTPPPVAQATIAASAPSAVVGQPVTLTWSSQNTGATNCQATGAWSGQVAASGSQQVIMAGSTAAYTASYGITCGSASSSAPVSVTVPTNTTKVVLDSGPAGANAFNVPYVSVTVCRPGTSTCQTIDHVMIDTGSFGLRLITPLNATLGLPAATAPSGAAVGECGQFVSGFTWGSVAQADVKVGGETALNQSIQLIGDTSVGAVPSTCTSVGADIGSVKALGANGVLGIGLFKQDCGADCASGPISGHYYACTTAGCSPIPMPLAQQVSNPVAAFGADSNGVALSFPAIATGGGSAPVGTLTFGIGTQATNGLGTASKYTVNSAGYVTAVYKGTTLPKSFIDSGSNGLYFNDAALTKCTLSTDFYCPATPQSLSATITGANGVTTTIPFTIENVDALPGSAVSGWIGGPSSTTGASADGFAFGLPFFFGRVVYIGMESDTAAPYWAF